MKKNSSLNSVVIVVYTIITQKGKIFTKKDIFDLREYFDKVSLGKITFNMEDFIMSFNHEKYSHMKSVAASLFNFLDKHKTGSITFNDFLVKLYPGLTQANFSLINQWSEEYNSKFNLERKVKANIKIEDSKKRILPKICLERFEQIFNFFDQGKKGYVDITDLNRVLGKICSSNQL